MTKRRVWKRRTYREMAETYWGIYMCGDPASCKRRWSWSAHFRGKVDNAGVIHSLRADKRARRDGLRPFLLHIAWVLHRPWWYEPKWRQIYLKETWVFREAKRVFHVRIGIEENKKARQQVLWLGHKAKAKLRSHHWTVYRWASRHLYTHKNTERAED